MIIDFRMDPRVRQLFKTLVYMGKDYPEALGGRAKFMRVLKQKFRQPVQENDLDKALAHGEHVVKGEYPPEIHDKHAFTN